MSVIMYGRLVSEIICVNEMLIRAKREGRSASELTPLFGSTHFIINAVQVGGLIYVVDKVSGVEKSSKTLGEPVIEERLILEVSTNIDKSQVLAGQTKYDLSNCPLVPEQEHFMGLTNKALYALVLSEPPFTRKNHFSKVQNREEGGKMLTGFLKTDAFNVKLEALDKQDEEGLLSMVEKALTPFQVMAKLCPLVPAKTGVSQIATGVTA